MSVTVHRAVPAAPLADAEVARLTERALDRGGRAGLRVDVVLVDDPTLADLHLRFLGDPAPTDVIAFDLDGPEGESPGPGAGPQAEIYVSVERAERVAARRGREPGAELALYLVHGALHLCGHGDHDPAERAAMRAAERALLAELGYPHDPDLHGA